MCANRLFGIKFRHRAELLFGGVIKVLCSLRSFSFGWVITAYEAAFWRITC